MSSITMAANNSRTTDLTFSFALIDDVCWQLVAQFSAPPDVYNLALSSKQFFGDVPTPNVVEAGSFCQVDGLQSEAGKKLNGQRCSVKRYVLKDKRYKVQMESSNSNDVNTFALKVTNLILLPPKLGTSNKYVASKMLRESLLVSLERVLKNSESGITLESALALADLPEGSAVIAGSTIVQTCLGELWGGDVDVFCTAKAAPDVRSWFVERNGIFIGFRDCYLDSAETHLNYTVGDTKIHHVEHWGSLEENIDENLEKTFDNWAGGRTVAEANKEGAGIDSDMLKSSDYYKDAVNAGKYVQENYVDWKWDRIHSLGVDQGKVYHIKPKPGDDLPFDFNGEGNIDLIVARKNVNTPYELLKDFDLTICRASFDGKIFRIPDPHCTFSRQSTMEPNRRAIVESYLKHYSNPESYLNGIEASAYALEAINKVRADVPDTPFYKQLDMAPRLSDYDHAPQDYDQYDPMVQSMYGAPILFHNWTRKLIMRLRKYQARDIDIIGAPTIDEDCLLYELCFAELM